MAMLRSAASRSLLRSFAASGAQASPALRQQPRSHVCTLSQRPLKLRVNHALVLTRKYAMDNIDRKAEEALENKPMSNDPSLVSATSSTHELSEELAKKKANEPNTAAGIKGEFDTIIDTFSMKEVPSQAITVGMAGVLPYLATSLSTAFCASEINTAAHAGTGYFMTAQSAELLLHAIEPIQVGFGAVIISFLGAIHWGLEWAAFGGSHGYRRYAIGVLSTAAAWPTLLLPVESALISQFLIFNFLYYADARASRRGWAPPWYGIYRFVLTFIVGGSLVVSLIARSHIAHMIDRPEGWGDRLTRLTEQQGVLEAEEEEARRKYLADE
ncbi:hypothetical protein K470DRAFT_234980 [Piedraia hortae CBS 480.64]|uniref:Uncharacterized protein n=1 Tax=Piedraia hortae CBS 480.64 TaxID=1314780 RepID=A0A6A7BV68_9PEZI|nr:hypothetical protein K470DRAFT_234980 [Piedraia hortae CBS 480.64]